MTITVKGQITIPQALRERYGWLPGTKVDFVPDEDGLRLLPHKAVPTERSAFDAWLAIAADSAATTTTTDKAMALTRGED